VGRPRSGSGVAVVGIGSVGCTRSSEEGLPVLINRAATSAFSDAGLTRDAVDGLFVQIGSPRGMDYDSIARSLALEVSYAGQTWAHGRFMATVQQHAALTLTAGLTTCCLCIGAYKNSAFTTYGTAGFPDYLEAFREGGGPHGERPESGLLAPICGAAMAANRYLLKYNLDRERLGSVSVAQRAWAMSNDGAVMRSPLNNEQYANSRMIVEPLRLLDCSVPIDTAVAVLLSTSERAHDLAQVPIELLGFQGLRAGPNEFVFGPPGLGVNQRDEGGRQDVTHHVFAAAGIGPDDVDAFYCYDGFSPQVPWTLERFGYCAPGEGLDLIDRRGIGPAGKLPVNTSGGNLSEGHSNGWGHVVELVRQLRGAAGERQLARCEVAQWATTFGDSIVYGR